MGRIQVGFLLNPHYQIAGGYAISNQYPHSGSGEAELEHRFHLQFTEILESEKHIFRNRFRWEYRLFDDISGQSEFTGYNRLRFQHKLIIPFKKNKKFSFVAAGELLFQSRAFECFSLNQNRTSAGIKHTFSKNFAAELISMNLLVDKKHSSYEMNDVFWLTISF